MSSSSKDGDDPPDKSSSNLNFNPFKLLDLTPSYSPDELKQAYYKKIRTCHPDKVQGREALAKKLIQAYHALKHADDKRRAELENQYSPARTQLRNVLVDKTLSELYRRVFQAHVDVAKETHFNNNFKSFYKQVFDGVDTPHFVVADSELCQLCEEEFVSKEDHFEQVFNPYLSFLIDGVDPGCMEYLEGLFGRETVRQDHAEFTLGIWAENLWSLKNKQFAQWIDYFKKLKAGVSTPPLRKLGVAPSNKEIISWMSTISGSSVKYDTVQEIARNILSHFAAFSTATEIMPCDSILPAFLHIFKDFTNWTNLSLHFTSLREPRWAILFAKVGASLNLNNEDFNGFLKVGDYLVDVDIRHAHICYLLAKTSLDLNFTFLGLRLAPRDNFQAKQLAVQYLLKDRAFECLLDLGTMSAQTDKNTSAIFLIPLFLQHVQEGFYNEAIHVLEIFLPKKKLWRCIQAMVADEPELLLCEAVARHAVQTAADAIKVTILVLSLPGGGGGGSDSSDQMLRTLAAIPGALHVLIEAEDEQHTYLKAKEVIIDQFLPLLLELAVNKSMELGKLIVPISKLPRALPVIEKLLTEKCFLGRNPVTPQPGQVYHAILLFLRGIYNYKRNNILQMLQDFEEASINLVANKLVTTPIADFITSNPLIQDKVSRLTSRQFAKLQEDHVDNNGEDFDPKKFPMLMSALEPNEEAPLSKVFSFKSSSSSDGPDLNTLEKDVLGRDEGHQEADEDGHLKNPDVFADIGYTYVDLSAIADSVEETVSCFVMAGAYFFRAMVATEETNHKDKFGYHGLILKCMKELKGYTNTTSLPPSIVLYAQRSRLSFIFQANHHFSQTLIILKKKSRSSSSSVSSFMKTLFGRPPTNFLDENKVPKMTAHWQTLLNVKTLLCPISTLKLHTIQEASIILTSDHLLNNALILKRIEKGVFSNNIPEYLANQILLYEVWGRRVNLESLEGIKYHGEEEETGDDEDGEKKRKNEEIRKKKEDWEKELKATPIIQREAFQSTRASSMKTLASLHGFGIDQVEHLMGWHVIRRTPQGFIDIHNRTLDFAGQEAFSKFEGVRINPNTKKYELLLQSCNPRDPQRPPLFTLQDVDEIFGNEIAAAVLSFDEQIYFEGLRDCEKIRLPVHPFFKVDYHGFAPSGTKSKEQICGTNFLMTLYHLDLLAKMLTTGQEVGANFPFPFQDTETHLLSNLGKELRRTLMPIGPRKKARLLRSVEQIHRFWFHIDNVEQYVEQPTQQNGGACTFRYGDASLVLKTMPMIRGEDGDLLDAESLMDVASPEAEFVREFNKKMAEIEKIFPIIQRTKELAKISLAFEILHVNKDTMVKSDPSFRNVFQPPLNPNRGYSQCRGNKGKSGGCTCCNWVPAVYHEMLVTDEQKLEHLFGNRFHTGKDAIPGMERGKLTFGSGSGKWEEGNDTSTGNQEPSSGENSKSKLNLPEWTLLEKYRVYGGVIFRPNIKALGTNSSLTSIGNIGRVVNLARTSIPPSRNPPPPPPPSGRGGGSGNNENKSPHKNSLNYGGDHWQYYIREKGGTMKATGKTGITGDAPVNGKLPRLERQLAKLGDNYEGGFRKLSTPGRRHAKSVESTGVNLYRRDDPKALPLEKGRHAQNPTSHYYPNRKLP